MTDPGETTQPSAGETTQPSPGETTQLSRAGGPTGRLDGRVAIVTGAGSGLGAATARLFGEQASAVAVVDIDAASAAASADGITGAGGRAIALTCDVAERAQVDAAVAATVDAFGGVDILVQYAQVIVIEVPFEELTEEQFVRSWRSGCLGSVHFMQECLPHLKKSRGRVVNVASGAAFDHPSGGAAYAMSKQAIRSVTLSAAKEWGRFGITVNAICPIAMTPAMNDWKAGFPDHFQQVVDAVPLRRIGEPSDVARGVLSIVTDLDYCTGMTFMLDGGATRS